jgi:N-acetyl-anhydromuramyl-L-alanine amidase AmpD
LKEFQVHFFRKTLAATAAAMSLAACGPQQEAPKPEAPPAEAPSTETQQDASRRTPYELNAVFADAAAEFDVPASLLKAISHAQTRWEHIQGAEEFEGQEAAFGVMGLRGRLIDDGAALAGVSADAVRAEPRANIRAGAALLSKFAAEAGIDRADLGAWAPVAVRLTDLTDPDIQAHYVHEELYAVIAEGATAFTPEGKVAVSLEPTAVEAKFALPRLRAFAAGPDYAASIWRPSPSFNSRPAGTDISMIIIHTCEGGYTSCINTLTNSVNQVSAHYVVNESGSEISQLVLETNRAWHVGATYSCSLNGSVLCGLNGQSVNNFTVGIEHAGFASQASFPAGQIDASAKLSCDISKDRTIVRDSFHIVAHGRLQPATRSDPGPNWPWSTYISKIKSYCGDGGTPTGAIIVDSTNTNNNSAVARFSTVGTWTAGANTGFYGSGYVYAATEAVSAPAVFEFYLAAPATKTIEAWWVAGSNRSTTAPFIITSASGTNLATVQVNQQINGSQWNSLGSWSFPAGWNKVQLSRWTGAGFVVVADAIRVY